MDLAASRGEVERPETQGKVRVALTFPFAPLSAALTGVEGTSGVAGGEDARVELSPSFLCGLVPSNSGGTGSRSKV
jgi:hypothetical protein